MSYEPTVIMTGTACMDEYYHLDRWICEGDKTEVRYISSEMGGMIANAACVLAGLGTYTRFLDTMKSSATTNRLIRQLGDFGVDTGLVRFDDTLPDARCFIFLSGQERTVMAVHGDKPKIQPDDHLLEQLFQADCLYTTLYNFQDFAAPDRLITSLRQNGVKTAFDIENHSYSPMDIYLMEHADILFFNEYGYDSYKNSDFDKGITCTVSHTASVAGTHAADGMSPCTTCGTDSSVDGASPCTDVPKRLLTCGVQVITVTLGASGCQCFTSQESVHIPGFKVPVIDTTGAGDTFNAAFLHQWLRGVPLSETARFANGAAALAVTRSGPKGGVNAEEDIRQFMAGANICGQTNIHAATAAANACGQTNIHTAPATASACGQSNIHTAPATANACSQSNIYLAPAQ